MEDQFHWKASEEHLRDLCAQQSFVLETNGRTLAAPGLRVNTPLSVPPAADHVEVDYGKLTAQEIATRQAQKRSGESPPCALARYLDNLPRELPSQVVLLMQAGATAIAAFRGGEPLATKSRKSYVVRGNGRAQPTYLATKGKSRYGSRLRLANAARLMGQTSDKLHDYWQEYGAPRHLFVGAPTRLWADFLRAKNKPPFDDRTRILRIPLDLPVPTTEVLMETYRRMAFGSIEHHVEGSPPSDF